MEWYKYADLAISMNSFGASGKDSDLFKYFGFTAEAISNQILSKL
jgi:transketolase